MPGMAGLIKTLLGSLPQIANIMVLFLVFLIVASTVGVQLFQGFFLYRCALTSTIPQSYFDKNVTSAANITTVNDVRSLNSSGVVVNVENIQPVEPLNETVTEKSTKIKLLYDNDKLEVFCVPE